MKRIKKIFFEWIARGVVCLFIVLILGVNGNGCHRLGQKVEKRLPYVMGDGSSGVIIIEYKPNSVMKENKKFGSYYYIITWSPSDEVIAKVPGLKEMLRHTDEPESTAIESVSHWLGSGVVKIAFYDKNGHSLLRREDSKYMTTYITTTFIPAGYQDHTYDALLIKDTLQWKGQFDESWLTFENFSDIDSVQVEYRSGSVPLR